MEKISVIGPGRWGTFLAWYMATHKKKQVALYGIESEPTYQQLKKYRKNDFLSIPENIKMTSNINDIMDSKYIIISINSQNLKNLAKELNQYDIKNKTFILAMKGIDIEYKSRLSQIMFNNIKQKINIAVLVGPGHVQDYTKGIPNCAVIDSSDDEVKKNVINLMSSNLIRLYYGNDLIGNEIGAAYKNVIGIAAGILDGLNYQSLKGALMSRSVFEVGKFIEKCGGESKTASGLSFLGDFEATLFSKHSNNRMFGEKLVVGGDMGSKTCEGYWTLKAVYEMTKDFNIDTPITNALYEIIYNKKDIKETLKLLFERKLKTEFWK